MIAFSLTLVLTAAGNAARADEIVAETTDTTAGGALGVGTGVMLGGAAGGPLGALVGAGIGLLVGKGLQSAGGLEERAYEVRGTDGENAVVRSPTTEFAIGQQVERRGSQLHAANTSEASR
nr:hypothetical protein [Halopseudomonas litoralis]